MQIVPTILEKEFCKAELKLKLVSGLYSWVQVDVVDGIYSPGKTFELELLNKTEFEFLWNVHLMVKEPIKWVEKCSFINASKVIGQIEMMSNREEFVNELIEHGMEVGLAFDVETKIDNIPAETDEILIMGRKAGFESQKFEMETLKKIEEAKKLKQEKGLKFKIGIDGGINDEILELLKKEEVDYAYCGNLIFNKNDVK